MLSDLLNTWRYKHSIHLSGSHAKRTALPDSDLDLLIQVDSHDPIATIQRSLADHVHGQIRNVSVRIILNNRSIDLIPARNNILWQARYDTWLKTDIREQIRYVRDSGLTTQIIALKHWRRRHVLRFPSFLLELAVIAQASSNLWNILAYLASDFPTARLLDPANSNNIVSDLLTPAEKSRIALTARMTLLNPDR